MGGCTCSRPLAVSTIYSLNDSAYDIARVLGDDNLASVPLWLVLRQEDDKHFRRDPHRPGHHPAVMAAPILQLGRALKSPVVAVKDDEEPVEEEDASGTSVLEEQLKALEENPEEAPAGNRSPAKPSAAPGLTRRKAPEGFLQKGRGFSCPPRKSRGRERQPGAGSIPPFLIEFCEGFWYSHMEICTPH